MSMIYPSVCEVCGRQLVDSENTMCGYCFIGIPRTNNHKTEFNNIEQRLAGGVPVERAASWFEYRRHSPYAEIIHKAKYHNRPDLARNLGIMYAEELLPDGFFDGIDILLPVPMHWRKKIMRGYNQAEEIAKGISHITGIPISDNLHASHGHKTQTRRSAYDRYLNVSSIFSVTDPEELQGRHVLLIDDVLTTGSTILSCCGTLASGVHGIRISVLTIASATKL